MKALSLFSGAGGDTLGMSLAGVEVVAYSELKPRFCETHAANFGGGCHLLGNDITKISDEDFATLRGQVDIIFAGFPCQPFSHGGKKKGREDPRGQMYLQFARAARIIQPKWIIGENVAGLARRTEDMTEILAEFKRAGYSCDHRTYKTDCFGVPQKRERLIILGKRGDEKPVLRDPPDNPKVGLQHILKFDMEGALRVTPETFEGVPPECILTDLKNTEGEKNPHPYIVRQRDRDLGFSFGKRDSPYHCEIVDLRKPSKTIICTYDHQPRLLVPLRNAKGCWVRAMGPDELKMIQGFPVDYTLCGNTKERVVQVGNAVPPQLIQWVCEGL